MHDIFVSYAHEDKQRVRMLVEAFEGQGWSVWWDDLVQIGTKYSRILDDALNHSRCVVVCWTQDAFDSEYVQSEVSRGEARHLLVQVMLGDVFLPEPLNEYALADLRQWPDIDGSERELEKLIRDIDGRLALARSNVPIDTSAHIPGFSGHPAVAVLPFLGSGDTKEIRYILDGVFEGVAERLQRFKSIPTISSHSTMAFKKNQNLIKIADQLGVQYLVTGHVRRIEKEYRLTIELIKTPALVPIWQSSESLRNFETSNLQDELSLTIAAQVAPEIGRSVRRAALPVREEDADVWHLVYQGIWHQYKLSADGAEMAKMLFDKAYEKDANSPETLVQLAWWHFWDISFRRGDPSEWSKIESFAQRASTIDPQDCRPVTLLGISHMMRGNHEAARREYKRAIDLNPSYAWAYAHMGSSLYLDDQPEAALVYTAKAVRLSPLDFFVFHAYCDMASSDYMLKNYSSALEAADYSLSLRRGYWLAHVIKICTLVRMGRPKQAEGALEEMIATKPNVTSRDINWIVFRNRDWNADLIDGLTQAGWKDS